MSTPFARINLGFSLVEMAIVLAIIALLMAGLLPTLSSQMEQGRRTETRKQLDEIQQALLGFAITNGYFPCPAVSASSGVEDRDSGTKICTGNKRAGFIPWVTLGVPKTDGWNRIFRYSASLNFTNASAVFSTSTTRDITIKTRDATGLVNLSNSNDIPVVVVSHGANGIYGTLDNGNTLPTSASTSYPNVADQQTNATGDGTVFVSRDPSGRTAPNDEEFDDLVIWISPNILFSRMVAAGKLP